MNATKNTNIDLREIKNDENIILVVHRHWFNILQQFFIILLLLLGLAGGFFISPRIFSVLQDKNYFILFLFVENTILLILWIYGFIIWIDYYFDIWVITTERIINIEQKGLFVRRVSELKFAKVQDVTAEVEGFLPTILNYGDVKVQTAGEEENLFLFRQVPDPYRIKTLIINLQSKTYHKDVQELGKIIHNFQ
jgi:uncharacterized membrane protein YdbT with pleckstrin-like domain